jgi:hypothetical protein
MGLNTSGFVIHPNDLMRKRNEKSNGRLNTNMTIKYLIGRIKINFPRYFKTEITPITLVSKVNTADQYKKKKVIR